MLKSIQRRKPVTQSPQQQTSQPNIPTASHCVEVGKFGLEGEIQQLQRDKNVLMVELVKLRQQQQSTEKEIISMGQRLQTTEQRQQQMMTFLAKAMQSPSFLSQLMQQSENKQFGDGRKKRRLPKQGEGIQEDNEQPNSNGQLVKYESGQNDSFSSTFFQLMNSDPDLKMELLSNPFEAFLREMLPSFFEQAQDSSHQQARATLTEYTEQQFVPGLPHDLSTQETASDDKIRSDTELDIDSLPLANLEVEGKY